MTEFSMKMTLNGVPYTDSQIMRLKYERALHVAHEFKRLGIELKDADGHEYSETDLNWLPAPELLKLVAKTHEELGYDQTIELLKDILADSDRRWHEWNKRPIEEQGCWIGVTTFDVKGVDLRQVQAKLAVLQNGATPFQIMPEHWGVQGSISEGQNILETFGAFGEPTLSYGVGRTDGSVPEYIPFERHTDYPAILAGETHLKSTGENIHVGAIHEFKPEADGFKQISTFFCPKDSPKEVADGHTIHFALEVGELIKLQAGTFTC